MPLPVFLDCTLRDGGYYNAWNFDHSLIQDYIFAVDLFAVTPTLYNIDSTSIYAL